ncbi:MAG: GNAT family N-acetyltransferase [Rhizobiaceae bacterium]
MAAPGTDRPVDIVLLPPGFDRWQELLDLILRAFAYMDGVIDPPSSAHRMTLVSLEEKCAAETVFLAVAEGRLAGCVFIAIRGVHANVGKLAVDPLLQGQGIGKRLLEAAEAEAKRLGRLVVELQTRVELTDNHAAFARLGFHETARTSHQGYDRPTSITMRKELAR